MSYIADTIYVFVFLIIVGILGVIGVILVDNVNDAFQNSNVDQIAKDAVGQADATYPSSIDWIFAMLFIGLPLVGFGIAAITSIPTIFYWLALGVNFFLTIIASFIQDSWVSYTSDSFIAGYATQLPIMNLIMTNFVIYVIVVMILLGIGTYVRFGAKGSVF